MKRTKGILFALISAGTFGLIPLFSISLIQSGMGLSSIIFYRFLFSTIMMGGACLLQKKRFRIEFKVLQKVLYVSILYAITALGLIFSYLYIPSGVATTIHFLYPVLVTFIMTVFYKEKKSVALFLAAAFSLAGVGFLTWSGGATLNPIGVLLILSIVVTYAVYIVGINKWSMDHMDSHVLTFYILLCATLLLGIYIVSTSELAPIGALSNWINLLLLAFLPTVISNLTLILAIKNVGSTVTSILGSVEPLVAVLVGVLWFKEDFGFYSVIGLTLVTTSVVLVVLTGKRAKQKDPAIG
ncbi:MAG: DMT family transporter [Bacteroidales bacterium]|jgi:drug/metabolite transporter (DMT)-like permease|nr:DMT family transporter [Bacteroidales bacterium]